MVNAKKNQKRTLGLSIIISLLTGWWWLSCMNRSEWVVLHEGICEGRELGALSIHHTIERVVPLLLKCGVSCKLSTLLSDTSGQSSKTLIHQILILNLLETHSLHQICNIGACIFSTHVFIFILDNTIL